MIRFSLILALCLGMTAAEAKPSASEPVSTSLSDAEYDATFSTIEGQLSSDPSGAASQLMAIIEDSTQSHAHGAAYGLLGEAFQKMGLPYSATVVFNKAFMTDMATNTKRVPLAIEQAQKSDRSALLGHAFSEYYGDIRSGNAREAVAYEAAKYAQQNGNFALANAMLSIVPAESAQYGQIKNLEGIILSNQGNAEGAVIPLLIAEQLALKGTDSDFINTTRINLARAYFAAGNFPRAVDYYKLVERDSAIW